MKLQSINPHDQSVVGAVEVTTQKDLASMVMKAKLAFASWKNTSIEKRAEYIRQYKKLLIDNKTKIAGLTTQEMGKPLQQALDDVDGELEFVDYYASTGVAALQDEVVLTKENKEFRTAFEPYGVCACIAPWNYPVSMFNSGVLPALVAGNTVIFKPSEDTTLTQKLLLELLNSTGLPDGVLQGAWGSKDVGAMLIEQPVDLVWFTGSAKVGQEIYKKCGEKFIKAICELGGSSAGIVFADADLENALKQVFGARFSNTGQICSAIKRLFVEKSVYNEFLQRLVEKVKQTKVGNPLEHVDMGPLVNQRQLNTLVAQVEDAFAKGAKVEVGGQRLDNGELAQGNYYAPTILSDINLDMRVMMEEVFGPVLPVMPFTAEDEAVSLANNTDYGLSAEIYTNDLDKANKLGRQLQSGVVAVNTDSYYYPQCPIGGYKKSGIGREYGRIGMREFTQLKLLAVAEIKKGLI